MDKIDRPIAVDKGLARPEPWNVSSLISQVAASGSITFTGTVTGSDEITVTLKSQQLLPDGEWVWSMVLTAETLAQIATALKNAINADLLLDSLGITASVVDETVTIVWKGGPLGNIATIEFATGVSETETATIVQFSGGSGFVTPKQNYKLVHNGGIIRLALGQPIQVDDALLAAIIAAGCAIE